jgi:chaperonin GroES
MGAILYDRRGEVKKKILTRMNAFVYNPRTLEHINRFINNNMAKKELKKGSIMPVGDRVLVKPESEADEKTASGIIIPDTARKEKPERGEVVAVGEGKRNDKGDVFPMRVKVGDTVVFSKYGYDEVTIDDEEYYIVQESNILAIIK